MSDITFTSCYAVSRNIRFKKPKVSLADFRAHVPKWVDKEGNLDPEIIREGIAKKELPNEAYDIPLNWERFHTNDLVEIHPGSCADMGIKLRSHEAQRRQDEAEGISETGFLKPDVFPPKGDPHFPEFVTQEGYVVAKYLDALMETTTA